MRIRDRSPRVKPDSPGPRPDGPVGVTPVGVTPGAVSPGAVAPGAMTPVAVTPVAVTPGAVAPGAGAAAGDGVEPGRSLVRNTRTMATATVASRVTGFLRTAVLAAVLGVGGLGQAYNVANTLPNNLYEFLLGGILTSTLVPLLVQARERDADGGLAYAQKLFSLVVATLVVVSVLGVLAAPTLVGLYDGSPNADELTLAGNWARFFLPQIVFYGMTAVFGALLNTRGRYAAPMWAPVLNNVVVIATLVLFVLVPGPAEPGPGALSTAQFVVLGVGTTAGVVAMTVALLPSLRAVGIRLRPRVDLRGLGLGAIGRLAAWTLVYVAATQLSYLVLTRLATPAHQQPTYIFAFTVWQLPHAVVAVSVITALLPGMSRHAVRGRVDRIRADIDRGTRLSVLLLVPASLAFIVLGRDIAVVLFAHGQTTVAEADRIGSTLAVFAVSLVPFSVYQLQSRAFYAMRDTRTPALIQLVVSLVLVVVDVALSAAVQGSDRVYALAAGHTVAYVCGVALSVALLRRRIGRPPLPTPTRWSMGGLLVRLVAAGVGGAVVVALVARLVGSVLPDGALGSGVSLLVAVPAGAAVYLATVLELGVGEARELVGGIRARLGR